MVSTLYTRAKQLFLTGALDLTTATLKAVLVSANYVPSTGHLSLVDLPTNARLAEAVSVTGVSVEDGVFDADDLTFYAVEGPAIVGAVVYRDTGVESTSTLVVCCSLSAPVTPTGSSVVLRWNNGATKIFSL